MLTVYHYPKCTTCRNALRWARIAQRSAGAGCRLPHRNFHLATDQNKKGFLPRLLLGSLADAPPRVRERMIETIPTTPLSLAFCW